MRKLSTDSRWRNSPRGAADKTPSNGKAGGQSPRHFANEVSTTLVRQLSQIRDSCSRHLATLADRIATRDSSCTREEATMDKSATQWFKRLWWTT